MLKIHEQVQEFSKNNYYILLLGVKNHPETIGTYSFCGNNSYIIETEEDIQNGIEAIKQSNLKDVLIISQTTFSVKLFDQIIEKISKLLDTSYNIHIEKTLLNVIIQRLIYVTQLILCHKYGQNVY